MLFLFLINFASVHLHQNFHHRCHSSWFPHLPLHRVNSGSNPNGSRLLIKKNTNSNSNTNLSNNNNVLIASKNKYINQPRLIYNNKSLEAVCNDTSRTTKDAYMIKLLKSTTL